MKRCKCGKEHDGSFGSGKFCSRSCANSRNWTDSDKKRKSDSAKKSFLVNEANKKSKNRKFRFVKNRYGERRNRVKWICPFCGKELTIRDNQKRSYCNNNTLCQELFHSQHQKQLIASGKRINNWGGRCKKIYYNGMKLDGSFELEFVKWCERNNISFQRNSQKFEYMFEGKLRYYFPDFKLNESTYIECKGYQTQKDIAKWNNFPHKLIIIKKNDIKKLKKDELSLEEVLNKYWRPGGVL